jgi:hypothetical protein
VNYLPPPRLNIESIEPTAGLDQGFVEAMSDLAAPLHIAPVRPTVEVAGSTLRLRSAPPGDDRFGEALAGFVERRFDTVWLTAPKRGGLVAELVVRRWPELDDPDDERSTIEVSATFSFAWWADHDACDATVAAVRSLARVVDGSAGWLGVNEGLESIYRPAGDELGIRGYGWLTILKPGQVRRLGGIDRVRERAPASVEAIVGASGGQPGALLRGSPVMASFIGAPARSLRTYLKRFIPNGDQDLKIEEAQTIVELGGSFSA